MAKGQMKSNKEAKKQKSDKPKSSVSEIQEVSRCERPGAESAGQEILAGLVRGQAAQPGGSFALML